MKRKFLLFIMLLLLLVVGCSNQEDLSFYDELCQNVSDHCTRVIHVDVDDQIVFFEDSLGLRYALMDQDFKSFMEHGGGMRINSSLKEDPVSWKGSTFGEKELSMLWGLARSKVRLIIVESENDKRPNHIKINDNLWLWYLPLYQDELNLPVDIKAYDEVGNQLFSCCTRN